MITEKLQSVLSQIETDLGERTANIINQLFGQEVTISVKEVSQSNPEDVLAIVGSPALMLQMAWDNGPNKITVLTGKDTLPTISDAVSGEEDKEKSQALLELKETISYVFADYAAYFSERIGQEMEFGSPEVQLQEVNKDDELFKASYQVVLNVDAGDAIHAQVFKIIPQALENTLLAEGSEIQEESPLENIEDPEEKVMVSGGEFNHLEDKGSMKVSRNLDTLLDLELPIIVELGRVKMLLKDILELGPGGIVELNKFSGEPVDLFVNSKKFAEGEVVVIEQNFGVRITALVSQQERISSLENQAA